MAIIVIFGCAVVTDPVYASLRDPSPETIRRTTLAVDIGAYTINGISAGIGVTNMAMSIPKKAKTPLIVIGCIAGFGSLFSGAKLAASGRLVPGIIGLSTGTFGLGMASWATTRTGKRKRGTFAGVRTLPSSHGKEPIRTIELGFRW